MSTTVSKARKFIVFDGEEGKPPFENNNIRSITLLLLPKAIQPERANNNELFLRRFGLSRNQSPDMHLYISRRVEGYNDHSCVQHPADTFCCVEAVWTGENDENREVYVTRRQ